MFSIMRKSLRETFDRIYIVNLHGDMRKRETGNPFNIRVGVAIVFMVRIDNSPNKKANVLNIRFFITYEYKNKLLYTWSTKHFNDLLTVNPYSHQSSISLV